MFGKATNRVAVVGSAQTEFRSKWGASQHIDLISTAVYEALRGTGIGIEEVDFVFDSGSDILDGRSISNCGFMGAAGAHHKEESRVEEDGLWAALYGATKIASGSAEVGVIVAYSKPSEGDIDAFYATQCEPFCQRPVGFDNNAACGLQAQLYLNAHNVDPSVFAEVAAFDWANAAANPSVETGEVPDRVVIAESPLKAAPLRELEISRPVDGAVAVVLASRAVAEKVTSSPVWVTGIGTAIDEHSFAMREAVRLRACEAAAETAYERAGIGDPANADLVETSATSAVGELMVLEAMGLAPVGGGIELYGEDGPIAINPSGGSLPADPVMATGLARLSEAALQLAGRVDHGPSDARMALVHGSGGIGMQNHCVFVLEA